MCILGADTKTKLSIKKAMDLGQIRAAIPKEAFVKSVGWSLYYMFFDYSIWIGSTYCLYKLHETGVYDTLPQYQQYGVTLAHWLVSGFFMWCIFVVGHDCGHGSFSNSTVINDIIGHVTHGSILVPYWPWRLSHNRHHLNHNHIENDYSHPWYTAEKLQRPDHDLARAMESFPWMRILFPIVGWPIYLYGMPDGSHWIPFADQRLWKDTDLYEKLRCVVSSLWVGVNLVAVYLLFGPSLSAIAYYYLVPYFVFGWWLVCVTYLQHHDHDTLVYGDDEWKYVDAAFETVDRTFGFGIDHLHHHITDGHVVHHLFFKSIPHYNLPVATRAIREYLNRLGAGAVYKHEETRDFAFRLHKYMYMFGFQATQAPTLKKAN